MPSSLKLSNNAAGRLASNRSASDTALILVPGDGARFPTLAADEYFPATLIRAVDGLVEIVRVTARSTDTLTVVRAQEGTGALAFQAGDRVEIRLTAGALQDEINRLEQQAADASNLAVGTVPPERLTGSYDIDISGTAQKAVTADTPPEGDNDISIATTEFVTRALQALYPVGSVYINAAVATNPATLLGFGTWAEIGAGRVLVGQKADDPVFDTIGETGGSKDAIVVNHSHAFSGTTSAVGDHQHINALGSIGLYGSSGTGTVGLYNGISNGSRDLTSGAGAHSHTMSGTTGATGSSGTNANLQPYVVVKMWQRVS